MKVKCPKCGKEDGKFSFFGECDGNGIISVVRHFVGYEIIDTPFGKDRVIKHVRCFLNIEETKLLVKFVEYYPGHFEIVLDEDYVELGVVSRKLGMQTQYVAHYIHSLGSCPNLSKGLRILDDIGNYHAIKIHKDDVEMLVARISEVRKEG